MRSVSGVRGIVGTDITPELVTRYARAFGTLMLRDDGGPVVVARDSRASGAMLASAVVSGLRSLGCDVIDCGLVPTPSAQLAVEHHSARGGIVVTASHNPIEWNALKFIGPDGLFLDSESGEALQALVSSGDREAGSNDQGSLAVDDQAADRHLDLILQLPFVDAESVGRRSPLVALDCVRGAGGVIMPALLERLGCEVRVINGETDGEFPRAPEPVAQNLGELCEFVIETGADFGLAVDPDVDRLAIVDETGTAIGEDYTLAFAVEFILSRKHGPVVINLSTSQVVDDAAARFDAPVRRTRVGEANVARAMRQEAAVIGGEGNGGVILPDLHLGRDAPLAAALIASFMVAFDLSVSQVVNRNPKYRIIKDKVSGIGAIEDAYDRLREVYGGATCDTQDGLRLSWDDRWLHVRPSGTEPIVRLIAEAPSEDVALSLIRKAKELMVVSSNS